MESIIRQQLEEYRRQFALSEEGFIKNWPKDFKIRGWLVSMKDGGKIAPHIHEDGG